MQEGVQKGVQKALRAVVAQSEDWLAECKCTLCCGAPGPRRCAQSVSDWRFACVSARGKTLSQKNLEITEKYTQIPDSSYSNQDRYHLGFVRGPSNGTEIAASGCEIARELCDRMCLTIFK